MTATTSTTAAGPATDRGPRGARSRRFLLQTGFFVLILAIWAAARALDVMSEDALPGPLGTLRTLIENLGTAEYWTAIGNTLRSAVAGLAAAAVVGIPIGLLTGTYPVAEKSSRLIVEFGRAFPVIAILPVLLLVMGTSLTMKALVVFLACVFPLIIQAQYGAASVTEAIHETVRAYRIGKWLRFTKVILPSAAPSVMTGLRLASTVAVLVCIGVEILTTVPGIGHEVVASQQDGNSENAFAYIFTAGALGYGINRFTMWAEARLLAWRPPAHVED